MNTKNNLRLILSLFTGIFILGFAGMYYHHKHRLPTPSEIKIDGTVLPQTRFIQPFNLTDNSGNSFNKDAIKGHWTLMFFGFTNCASICPTAMSALAKMYRQLESHIPQQLLPQVVMVSVDPERDTVKRMNDYVKSFDSHFIGVNGNMDETKAFANQMSVVFEKVDMPNGNYYMNHSAEIMLMDPAGNLRAFFSSPHVPEHMVQDYEAIIRAYR